jgi:2-methylcitrate dehydratase PrpD
MAERRFPKNAASAGNSIPFAVARTLIHGDLLLSDFTDEGLKDPIANAVATRTGYALRAGLKGGLVEVFTNDGGEHRVQVEAPLGHPSRPVPYERLLTKFRDCCRYSVCPLSADRIDRLIALIENLENEDFRMLARLSSEHTFA